MVTKNEPRLPDSWPGLLAWAVRRFGPTAFVCGLCIAVTGRLYYDARTDRDTVLTVLKENHELLVRILEACERIEDDVRRILSSIH